MLQSTSGSLTILDANTATPSVFWKGQKVNNVVRIKVKDALVVLGIYKGTQTDLYAEMALNNIKVKLGK